MRPIGENIRMLREAAGLTQAEMGVLLETSAQSISGLERSQRGIGPKNMKKMIEILGWDEQTIRFGVQREQQESSELILEPPKSTNPRQMLAGDLFASLPIDVQEELIGIMIERKRALATRQE